MLDVYICEDDKKQLSTITDIIKKNIIIESYDMQIVASVTDPFKLLEFAETSKRIGIYFLDIKLGTSMDGFELARKIREFDPRGFVIFITCDAEDYKLTFEHRCEAMDYIVKGLDTNLAQRIRECLNDVDKRMASKSVKKNDVFSFKTGDYIAHENFENIILIETNMVSKHKVSLYSVHRAADFRATLKEIETRLDDRFIKVNNSCIVNADKIVEINRKDRKVVLESGQTVTIATRRLQNVLKKYSERMIA